MEKYRCKCLYGFVLATNGASETAREYNSKQLHNSNSYAHTTEHHSDILKVSDEFVQAAVFVEVFRGLSAWGSHSAGDLLAWAARAGQGGDVVGSPVTGAVDTAALQISLHDVEGLGDVLVSGVFLDGLVQVVYYGVLQVLMSHVARNADSHLSHEDD